MTRSLLVLSLLILSSCLFDGGDDPMPDYCASLGAPLTLRNPYTGTCDSYGTSDWPDEPCTGACCPANTGDGAAVPLPTWGYCESICTGLDEDTCLGQTGCRAIYMDWCPGAGCPDNQVFTDCWPTDQSGYTRPEGTECETLDALSCSYYDDCAAVHRNACEQVVDLPQPVDASCSESDFARCTPEPGQVPACSELADEATCLERTECEPVYEGIDCTCDESDNCTCEDWAFVGCQDMV